MTAPLRRLSPVVRLAPAKLNLTLAVVGRRDDGYHTLHSVFVPLTLADRLSLAPAGGDRDTLHVSGLDAGPPADNLVFRALAVARAAVGSTYTLGLAAPFAVIQRAFVEDLEEDFVDVRMGFRNFIEQDDAGRGGEPLDVEVVAQHVLGQVHAVDEGQVDHGHR